MSAEVQIDARIGQVIGRVQVETKGWTVLQQGRNAVKRQSNDGGVDERGTEIVSLRTERCDLSSATRRSERKNRGGKRGNEYEVGGSRKEESKHDSKQWSSRFTLHDSRLFSLRVGSLSGRSTVVKAVIPSRAKSTQPRSQGRVHI